MPQGAPFVAKSSPLGRIPPICCVGIQATQGGVMQLVRNVLAALVNLWNRGCLGKIAVGFLALMVLGICGAPFRGSSTRTVAPTSAPVAQAVAQWIAAPQATTAPQATQKPTEAPKPTNTPAATATPEPTAPPTETPAATPAPKPTARPEPTQVLAPAQPVVATNSDGVAGQGYDCPAEYPIKGNINSKGEHIYHSPGGAFYSRTKPERCFATAGDAQATGFRPSQR